ncbi:hypothetical protein KUL25_20875 [Rhodobacteraceae bacterium N5(2021)]|uniref:Uncharacterized protein n=1 Tax=Gymnodinialimonas phycosphaerae TaxID=2841589 RepID=A0A975TUB2_9RHOB|nr:hypothetical protein [Gymnodinialimonas phycosphaerae]MBY4895224.1 hypothetical protein [Gymnodinialimonas phycosphaerae]
MFLVACVPQSGSLVSPDTGLSGHYSRQVVIFNDAHHVLYGHVLITHRNGETLRTLVVSQRRDGVHRLRFSEAWSGGIQLPFRRASALDGCSHGHCLNHHAGLIFLSEALFTHAQSHGLHARLVSGTTNLDISVPASLFHLPPT